MNHKKNEAEKILKKELNLNVKFNGAGPNFEMKEVPFKISEMLFNSIVKYSKRQIAAQCKLYDMPNNTISWTDEEFVVHAYQSMMKQTFNEFITHTKLLELQLKQSKAKK